MDGVRFIGTISTAVTMTGTILAQLIVEGTTKRVVQDLTAQHQTAGHAILCRLRLMYCVTEYNVHPSCIMNMDEDIRRGAMACGASSHGFCMPAQRWKSTSITTKAWRHEHLNVTLFDETEMVQEEPPEEEAEDPESTGTAVAEANTQNASCICAARTASTHRRCACIVPMMR